MKGQNVKIALRRILRNYKSNLMIFAGLIIGLTSSLIIYTKISYELSFDSFHTQSKNIYRVVRVTSGLDYTNGGLEYRTGVFSALPPEIKKSIPGLQNVTSMMYVYGQKVSIPSKDNTIEKSFTLDDGVVFTEPSFFEVFDFGASAIKWIYGEGKQVLDKPYSAVITEEISHKLFQDQDPVGQDIFLFDTKFTIGGVIQDFPKNTDLPFKVILSLATYCEKFNPGSVTDWGNLSDNFQCYVVLNKKNDKGLIEKKIKEIYSPHAEGDYSERRLFKLQPLSQVHRESQFGNYNNRTVSTGLLLALTLIGSFIFLIACFNYSNFFLAETIKQKKQIALKLILGSKPVSIFNQFLTESLLLNICALVFSLQITFPVLRNFYSFIDIPQGYIPELNSAVILFVLGLLFTGGIIAVIFSFFNLNLRSLSALLKRSDSSYSGKVNTFGKASVILQFVVAQIVIIATLIIVKQIYFINHAELGYSTDKILFARLPENAEPKLTSLAGELLAVPFVEGVSYSSVVPAESQQWTSFSLFNNNDNIEKRIDAEIKLVDSSYLKLYSFHLLAGHNFSSNDTSGAIILNSEFLTEIGFNNVDEAIGTIIRGPGQSKLYIKGVVQDFHSGSLRDKIRPCVFYNSPSGFRKVSIKLAYPATSGKKVSEVFPGDIQKLNEVWKKIFPDQVFTYTFINDRISEYYKSDRKALNLFLMFASITIFLCILGILGLSLSINERRTKEIGLRRVNGANVSEIVALLNRNFMRWIALAFLFAAPVAWFGMHKWLQNFAYRTELSWWIFILAGLIALTIALFTLSWQSWRAATRNPVEALRYE
jgi:putative ABC transport system permease protein